MAEIPEDIKSLSFEDAYQQLVETVEKLEAGNLSLEESLALYRQGMALAEHCGIQLDQAELTVQKLTPTGDLVDFDEF